MINRQQPLSVMENTEYNDLPTLDAADAAFTNRDEVLKKLAQLLTSLPEEYKGLYAISLVHHHYDLNPGEIMVTNDRITAPELIASMHDSANVVPERWTAAGMPFEYVRLKEGEVGVPPPPDFLLEAFQKIVGSLPLGLMAAPDVPPGKIVKDSTLDPEKRSQVLEVVDEDVYGAESTSEFSPCRMITAAWNARGEGEVVFVVACGGCRWPVGGKPTCW
ncbi:hypothetical protein CC1G_06633 [Coprinopsis cinerea okayama7|uniref:Uncharacterized protein n=1 Tax=Coprinopsis cinerea (strain Okayama-7 / 130 / ATCC MYA-4618 / FGSC 9003) TaxID=240176 RepID=A8P7T5_COPC7|nr:hypothetical protein CC1G_06633 [Coprinopsis cinerea okayama7\|eukprot:XP_001839420.2 hypothetical protein CC1G_06633 [Coprinopsis cinerea okayama7\